MTDNTAHALFSPSSASKWMRCPGSLAMEEGMPNTTNSAAEEGTAAHELASWALTDDTHYCLAYLGRITSNDWEVTEEMCEYVQVYVDAIRARVDEYKLGGASEVTLMIENRVEFSELVGVPDQFGTSDAIFLVEYPDGTALIGVEDLKYGYGIVHAIRNEQLMVYALAALEQYGMMANFTRARMVIHQPRREHVSDWECSIEDLQEFAKDVRSAAQMAFNLLERKQTNNLPQSVLTERLYPGEKQCQWCKRNGDCPALAGWAEKLLENDFEDLTKENVLAPLEEKPEETPESRGELLSKYLKAMPLLDIFTRGILSAAESHMFNGGRIPDYKVVMGKKGNRKFRDAKEAEDLLKSMRYKVEQMYSLKLISPTAAEALIKKSSPRRWKKVSELITQSDGKPSIAELSDKREAITISPLEDDFDVILEDVVFDGNDDLA